MIYRKKYFSTKLTNMEIAEIKQRLSILTVLAHYNLKPDKNHRLCCPFHLDKTPSFQVYPKSDTWTCFSSNCSAGSGDQIDFIMKKEGTTKHEAILKAEEFAGHNGSPVLQQNKPKSEITVLTQEQRTAILTKAFTHFVRS